MSSIPSTDYEDFVQGWNDYVDCVIYFVSGNPEDAYEAGYSQAQFFDDLGGDPPTKEEAGSWALELGYLPEYPAWERELGYSFEEAPRTCSSCGKAKGKCRKSCKKSRKT
jgi:hypothetical protein